MNGDQSTAPQVALVVGSGIAAGWVFCRVFLQGEEGEGENGGAV